MCSVSRERLPDHQLIRFVLSPDNVVVADLKHQLPGRGVWVKARRDLVDQAIDKRMFQRGFKMACDVEEGLALLIEARLEDYALNYLPLLRKAGLVVAGFEKVSAALKSGQVAALLAASDGSEDGKSKLQRLSQALPGERRLIEIFDSGKLGLAFGRSSVIHAAVNRSALAQKLIEAVDRLVYYRSAC